VRGRGNKDKHEAFHGYAVCISLILGSTLQSYPWYIAVLVRGGRGRKVGGVVRGGRVAMASGNGPIRPNALPTTDEIGIFKIVSVFVFYIIIVFLGVLDFGCGFHWTQCIFRHIKSLGKMNNKTYNNINIQQITTLKFCDRFNKSIP
jgi:hypothetical protein